MANFQKWWLFCQAPNRDGSANDTDPTDGAGVTRWGWTYPTWVDAMNYSGQGHHATVTYFAHMDQDQAGTLAEAYFWVRLGGDSLPGGSDVSFIDWAWNSGNAAVKTVQDKLDCSIDGVVGPQTLTAIEAYGQRAFVDACCQWRTAFLDDHGFRGKDAGLYDRTTACHALALTLI